jgi:CheY-like chemotaxis protein
MPRWEYRGVGASVLVVDDDPSFLSLASRIIQSAGLDVVATARDAEAAIAQAHAHKPQAALVDITLPGRDGIDLCRQLVALPWEPRVVLTSTDRDALAGVAETDCARALPFVAKQDLPAAPLRRLLSTD